MWTIIILAVIIIIIICIVARSNRISNPFGYADMRSSYIMPELLYDIVSSDKRRDIMDYAEPILVHSQVVGGLQPSVRNSMQCWIPKINPLVEPIVRGLSSKYNIPFECAEDIQIVRYRPGEYYKQHHDSCCIDNTDCQKFMMRGGHRQLTVLIYLNDKFNGGSTYFSTMDYRIKPSPGNAVVFRPLDKSCHQCHPLALHGGEPVTSGEKWVMNVWFRENEFK